MAAVRLDTFRGRVPRLDKRLLPKTSAQEADNVRLTSGRLDPVDDATEIATVRSGTVKSIFRMYSGSTDYWLNWLEDVDIVRGPIAGDTTFRSYFTSDSFEPRVTNLTLATGGTPYPNSWYVLGVTPPITKPNVTTAGGAAANVTRVYVYTFVTQWGEESAPSPAGDSDTAPSDATWTIGGMDVAPANSYSISAASWSGGVLTLTVNTVFGLRAGEYVTLSGLAPTSLNVSHKVKTASGTTVTIDLANNPGAITDQVGTATRDAPHNTMGMKKRIYRSVTSGSDATYYFVKEVDVATTSTTDDAATVGEALETADWLMPPVDLQGLRLLPSGALCGFTGNTLCMSVPSAPYAWPLEYQWSMDYSVVGIGVFGSSVAVCTAGVPYLAVGTEPESVTLQKLDQIWPCLAKRGIAEYEGGVVYPTTLGLARISSSGADLLTKDLYSQYEWKHLSPSAFVAAHYDGAYFTVCKPTGESYVLVVNPEYGVMVRNVQPDELYTDPGNGKLYAVYSGKIYELDSNTAIQTTMNWLSKEPLIEEPRNFGAAVVDADFGEVPDGVDSTNSSRQTANAAILTAGATTGVVNGAQVNNLAVNGSNLTDLIGDRYVGVTFYVDGTLWFSKRVTSTDPFRLPAGKKYTTLSVRLSANIPVRSIALADTMRELKKA